MKNTITSLLILLIVHSASAQNCNTAPTNIVPMTYTTPGFYPGSAQLPCIYAGQPVKDTIYFTNYTSIGGNAVSSLSIDSIENLPAGLCWVSNKRFNSFAGGENGVIYISGVTNARPGQYKLRIMTTAVLGSIALPSTNADTFGLSCYLRISCPNSFCQPLDTARGITTAFIPDTTCIYTPPNLINDGSGFGVLCSDKPDTLTANGSAGATYLWSRGDTSQSIGIDTPGIYTVVITSNGVSDTSSIQIVGIASPIALFSILPDTSTPHVWYILNQCSGNNLIYHWNWGDGSWTDSVAAPSHTYSTPGYYSICVIVSSDSGCSSFYCDTPVYLYKTENQMVQVNVINTPLGIGNINGSAQSIKYYAGAVHFAQVITVPTDVKLYDLSGRLVMRQDKFTGTVLAIPSSGIATGVYLIHLQNANGTQSAKLSIVSE